MDYKITGGIVGIKKRIEYVCPTCNSALESAIEDAGQKYNCPTCRHPLIVPGSEALEQHRQEIRQRESQKASARQQKERAAIEEQKAAADREAQEVAKAAWLARQPPEYRGIVRSATWLSGFAFFANICGGFLMLCGVVGLAIATKAAVEKSVDTREVILTSQSLVALFGGVLYLGFGALLKMVGQMGLAVRDLSRNSFSGR